MRTRAVVESPLQVLGLAEAVGSGASGGTVAVLARTTAARDTLAALLLAGPRTDDVHHDDRRSRPGRAAHLRPARTLVLGDALSGVGQLLLLVAGPRARVVLLDDGTATLLVVAALTGHGRLTRPPGPVGPHRRALAALALRTLRARARRGRLVLLTCLPLEPSASAALRRAGVDVHRHTFARVRTRAEVVPPAEDIVVLGSALADDGLVDPAAYERWAVDRIRDARAAGLTVRYLPHRREPDARLARLALAGARVARSTLPAEITLRDLAAGRRVVSLPTSVLATLGPALHASGVVVEAVAVPSSWWTTRATPDLRAHLAEPLAILGRTTSPTRPTERHPTT